MVKKRNKAENIALESHVKCANSRNRTPAIIKRICPILIVNRVLFFPTLYTVHLW